MYICVAGDIHGALDLLYEDVLALESRLGITFDWVLQVGDFGVWPDPERIDKASRKHEGAGDFSRWLSQGKAAPRRTLFIKGNHEDFEWLDSRASNEVLPNLFYLRNGRTFDLGGFIVGGIGGCYGPSNYERPAVSLQGYARRHYTSDDIARLISAHHVGPGIDFLLTHDAPTGVVFPTHRQGRNWASTALGLGDLVRAIKPLMCFFGHHHTRLNANIHGVSCVGLNKIRRPGHLLTLNLSGIVPATHVPQRDNQGTV